MAYFETLEYVDGGGTTHEVALRLPNLAATGAVSIKLMPRSHAAGTCEIAWPQPPETGIAIPFRSRCKVHARRSSSTGAPDSFSGGSIIFQGRRTDNPGSASASRILTSIIISDAWWDLQHVTYTIPWNYVSGGTIGSPTYSTFDWPDIVLFQATPGVTYSPAAVAGTITTFQQMKAIIDFASGYGTGDDAVQIQIGSSAEFDPVYVNWYPVRSAKCGECLNFCLRPHPGVYSEMDYTTTPPTIHFRNRANLTAINLPFKETDAGGITHIASEIEPLNHLVPDNVRLFYKINGTYNGQPVVAYSSDAWPDATNHLLSLDFSIDVTGSSRAETRCDFISAAFDPTSKTLWRNKVPALRQISEGGQIANDGGAGALTFLSTSAYNSSTNPKGIQVIDESGATIDFSSGHYEYYTDGDIYSWFEISGVPVNAKIATVRAFFSYDKKTTGGGVNLTDTHYEHEHQFRILLTDAPAGTYVLAQTLNPGESIPSGLAQAFYTELSTLQWKLTHEIIQTGATTADVPTLIKPGLHTINLVGGDTAWETMNAVPENVSIELFATGDGRLAARHSINCGPVNHLEPGYLIELHNLFWNRNLAGIDAYQRLSGSLSSNLVALTASAPKENSTAAPPVPTVKNFYGVDAADATRANVITSSAATGQTSIVQTDASDGTTLVSSLLMAEFTGSGAPGPSTLP